MRIKELAEKCKEVNIDCDVCTCKEECNLLQHNLEDMSPFGLVEMVEENHIVD